MRLSARDTRPVSPRVQFTHHSQNVEHMAPAKRRLTIWRTSSLLLVAFLLVAAGCSDASESDSQPSEPPDDPSEHAANPSCASESDGQPSESPDDPSENDLNPSDIPQSGSIVYAEGGGGDVHIGQLDNGLTYYLDSNWTPHDSLTLILVVKAGSLHESEPASGVAHFVEHMMFNGTEEFPGNTIYDELREFGLEMGPDLNAFTTYDHTIYLLTGLSDDADSVETGFAVLSQWAHAATIAPDAVGSERGVVRDEYRLRSGTSHGVALDSSLRLLTKDTPYEQRPPTGSAAGIEEATAADLVEFYDTWYVPLNMAVVAVGDLTVDELEDLTEDYFGQITAHDPPAAPDTNSPLSPESKIEVTATPGQADPYLSLYLQIPVWDPTTPQGERAEQLELLLANAIDIRLRAAYDQGLLSQKDPPAWAAFSNAAGLRHSGTGVRADDLSQAVSEVWAVLQSLAAQGFNEDDLTQAKARILSELQLTADNVEVTYNVTYALQYANHFLVGASVETSPERLERVSALLETIQPDELTSHLQSILTQSGPIISINAEDVTEVPTADEIQAALNSAQAVELAPAEALIDELMTPPDPVEPISQGPIPNLKVGGWDDPYEWSFANGARVNFSNSPGESLVRIEAVSLGGWSTLEPGYRPLAEVLAPLVVAQSGLADLAPGQIAQHLRTTQVSVWPFITETTEGFTGSAPSGEAETLFAMLHLLICEARVDDKAFNSVITIAQQQASYLESDWMSQVRVAYNEARHGDQIEWFHPVASQEVLGEVTAESLLDIYQSRLSNANGLLVVISGDLEHDTVERLASRYIGTLPSGEPDTYTNRRPTHPTGIVRKEVVLADDTSPTGITVYHEALQPIDPQAEAVLKVLEAVLNARLLSDIREDIGASYSVSASLNPQFMPESAINSEINASGAPESINEIRDEIIRILDELATNGPSATELRSAVSVVELNHSLFESSEDALVRRIHTPDSEMPSVTDRNSELSKLTAADVQALADELYGTGQHIEVARVLS